MKSITAYLNENKDCDDSNSRIFYSYDKNKSISMSYFNKLVKKWCDDINLRGHFSTHTLRKTWAYHQRFTFQRDLTSIMRALNHSNEATTMLYLGITTREIQSMFQYSL